MIWATVRLATPNRLRRRIEIEGRKKQMSDSNDKPTLGRKPLGLKTLGRGG